MAGLVPAIRVVPNGSKQVVDARVKPGHDGRERLLSENPRQCTAAYMMRLSVASATSISSTMRPWRATRMRSESAMISGR